MLTGAPTLLAILARFVAACRAAAAACRFSLDSPRPLAPGVPASKAPAPASTTSRGTAPGPLVAGPPTRRMIRLPGPALTLRRRCCSPCCCCCCRCHHAPANRAMRWTAASTPASVPLALCLMGFSCSRGRMAPSTCSSLWGRQEASSETSSDFNGSGPTYMDSSAGSMLPPLGRACTLTLCRGVGIPLSSLLSSAGRKPCRHTTPSKVTTLTTAAGSAPDRASRMALVAPARLLTPRVESRTRTMWGGGALPGLSKGGAPAGRGKTYSTASSHSSA
mmetsp:Transcript_13367/g.28591  ORF Transcript_13367/g.28591 Transcript_13367/m.28591 type:complete len:277 (-) Transcript_13367:500-1330(-)